MNWKRYDPGEVCVKCGRDGTSHTIELLAESAHVGYTLPERFRIECRKCSFKWHRVPLDADVEQVNREHNREAH